MLSARMSSSRWSASTTMLRNFSIVNDRPLTPTRSWRYSTGPGLVSRTASAMASSTGASSSRASARGARGRRRP